MGRRGIPKQRMELISNEKARYVTFQKRRKCLEKKAYELSTLCGVEACVIVYGPKLKDQHRPIDQPEIWPKDPDAIRRMFISYKERSDEDRCKRTLDLSDLFEDDPEKKKKKKKAEKTKYPSWDDSYNGLSEEQLRVFGTILEEKLQAAKTRVQFLKGNYPKLAGSTMVDSFLATQATTQNHSYFLQSEEAIHEEQQQQPPISLVNLQRELDMPVYYPPFDLSMPNSMMKMDDTDCNIIELGDSSSGTSNVTYNTTPTNSSFFYDSTCGTLENVIMDNHMPPPMCYYDPTGQPNMLSSMPNLMMMMNMEDMYDCIGLGSGVSGSNFTYYNTPVNDPMFSMPPPLCYYGPGQHATDDTGHELSDDLNSSILYAC